MTTRLCYLCLFVVLGHLGAQGVTFEITRLGADVPDFSHPGHPLSGDFNQDGVSDLAVVADGAAWVFIGNRTGVFAPPVRLAAATADALAVGDFNGDGFADIAVGGDAIQILPGKGDGTFDKAIALDSSALGITAVDVDMDGKLDLIVERQDDVQVFLGKGDGSFVPGNTIGVALKTGYRMLVGDFNGDGKPDLLHTASLSLFFGNGDATFQSAQTLSLAGYRVTAAADLNKDGVWDLIGSGQNFDVAIFLGSKEGQFARSAERPAFNQVLGVTDLDGDGNPDLLTVYYAYDGLYCGCFVAEARPAFGRGDGTFDARLNSDPFAQIYFTVDDINLAFVAGDFDGDGARDVLFSSTVGPSSNGGIFLTLAKPGGGFSFASKVIGGRDLISITAADFDRDEKIDIAAANFEGAAVLLWSGNGDGTFKGTRMVLSGGESAGLALGDFDGNGSTDIVTGGRMLLGTGTGTGGFRPAPLSSAALPWLAVAADLNRDGKPDLIGSDDQWGLWAVVGNGDGSFRTTALPRSQIAPYFGFGTVADFNRDGNPDLVTGNVYDDTAAIYFGNGDGTFKTPAHLGLPLRADASISADFDGNGAPDVAISFGQLYIGTLRSRGDGSFTTGSVIQTNGARVLGSADFDGDGKADLVACLAQCQLFLGKGDGTFTTGPVVGSVPGAFSLVVADFNNDGLPDFAVANRNSTEVTVFLNKK